jgi:hypothetical protein
MGLHCASEGDITGSRCARCDTFNLKGMIDRKDVSIERESQHAIDLSTSKQADTPHLTLMSRRVNSIVTCRQHLAGQ